jgi:putative redox protein
MAKQPIEFTNEDGLTLRGEIYWPPGRVRAFALFAHCFTCTRKSKAAVAIAVALNRAGFAVLIFDFTGLGGSEGEFAESNFTTSVGDLIAAARYLEEQHQAPAVLIGHSLGGTAVLAAAGRIRSCRAIATLGAPARAAHITHLFSDHVDEIEREGVARVEFGERPFTVKRRFLDDVASQSVPENLRTLRCALMIMHAPLDTFVSIDNAAEIFAHAVHPKSFVSLDDADHLLTRHADADYAATVLAAWAERYVDAPDSGVDAAPGVVANTREGGFSTALVAGAHAWISDEPVSAGGADLGPTPYDMLTAALASCTSMTLQAYARRKQWTLTNVSVHVEHSRTHADDCADCETSNAMIDRFVRVIRLAGDLDSEKRARLLEIADRCPVHRTLTGEIRIETRLDAD